MRIPTVFTGYIYIYVAHSRDIIRKYNTRDDNETHEDGVITYTTLARSRRIPI